MDGVWVVVCRWGGAGPTISGQTPTCAHMLGALPLQHLGVEGRVRGSGEGGRRGELRGGPLGRGRGKAGEERKKLCI